MKKFEAGRGKRYFSLAYLVVSILILIGSVHDSFLYKETIAEVISVQTKASAQESGTMYEQEIEAKILNGVWKGEQISLTNLYSKSLTVDEKYRKGNQVFLSLSEKDGALEGKIAGLKRDTYVFAAFLIFFYFLCMAAGKRGLTTMVSAGINIVLFYLALCFYEKGSYIFLVTIILMILFTVLSLICASGVNRVTQAAILATLLSVAAVGVIYFIVSKLVGEPEYFMMEYTEYLPNTNQFGMLFFAQILIGGLGAIMDVAISISTTAGELIFVNPRISTESLYDGVRNVAQDIMGTMINVLFLSYFCGAIPLILIKMINNYGFTEIFKFHIPFELIQFLTGSIGILLAIPISTWVSIRIFKRKGEVA